MDGPMEYLRRTRISIVPNKEHSCRGALARWQRRGLWGNPIWLGPTKCHVYGLWRKRVRMEVEFTEKQIVFIVHLNPKEKTCELVKSRRSCLPSGRSSRPKSVTS